MSDVASTEQDAAAAQNQAPTPTSKAAVKVSALLATPQQRATIVHHFLTLLYTRNKSTKQNSKKDYIDFVPVFKEKHPEFTTGKQTRWQQHVATNLQTCCKHANCMCSAAICSVNTTANVHADVEWEAVQKRYNSDSSILARWYSVHPEGVPENKRRKDQECLIPAFAVYKELVEKYKSNPALSGLPNEVASAA